MLNITLIAVGKLKEKHWSDAFAEYVKRLKPYAKIKLVELAEEPFRDQAEREKIIKIEAEKITRAIPDDAVIVALHERGKEFTSPQFADWLKENGEVGQSIVFIIGGSLGLHESILKSVRLQLSLSQLTIPHQMVRVFFMEQVYRAVMIQMKKAYHY